MTGITGAGSRDRAGVWSSCGAAWLTDPAVGVPAHVVEVVTGLVDRLDRRGAGLTELFGHGGLGVLTERAALLGLGSSGRHSCGGATRLLRCDDGWIAISIARPDDVAAVPAWLELGPAGVDPDDPWSAVERAVAARDVVELVERAGLIGLACSAVGETNDHRALIAERVGDAPPASLDGLVVVNLGALWAAPLAADVLARLGARVITVESTARPDGARATPAFFEALHGRTESVALPLDTEPGRRRLAALLRKADVVIEASRPRALAQMGIDAHAVAREGPRIWLSITAHGRDDAHAHRVGYGDDAAAAGGLVGWVGGEPRFLADAIADPLTGLQAADVVAELAETGSRWFVDIALARVAAEVATQAPAGWPTTPGPVTPPRRRADLGRPLPLGRDTDRVLADLGVTP